MIIKNILEKGFDKAPFSELFANKYKYEFLSIGFESLFNNYCGDVDDSYFSFPIRNYLLDRYLGEQHSFLDGDVVVKLRYPVTIQKKGKTKTFLMYSPEFWAMFNLIKEEFGEVLLDGFVKNFSRTIARRYPSIKNLYQGEKIRFAEVKYEFSSGTRKKKFLE